MIDSLDTIKIGERLHFLRIKHNLSFEKLKDKLENETSVVISVDSLKNYEVRDLNHAKKGNQKGMKIEYLFAFAKVYNVSTDYILGIEEESTHDKHFICKTTGLSEKALDVIISDKEFSQLGLSKLEIQENKTVGIYALVLNKLLESAWSQTLFLDLYKYLYMKYNQKSYVIENRAIPTEIIHNSLLMEIENVLKEYRRKNSKPIDISSIDPNNIPSNLQLLSSILPSQTE